MYKAIPLALLIGGIILITFGITASHSVGSSISRTVNGAPSERTVWLLIGGGAAALVGHAAMMRGSKRSK